MYSVCVCACVSVCDVNWGSKSRLSMSHMMGEVQVGLWVLTPSLMRHGTASYGVPVLPPGGCLHNSYHLSSAQVAM